jgi:hypothetical protein
MFQQMFGTQWNMFTPIVYRMMEREFVDRFFSTGELMISSFVDFRKHKDEERKDDEGKNVLCLRGDNSTAMAVTVHGFNEYILCGSAIKDKALMSAFGCDAAIQIFNTTEFANIIARHIPGVVRGFEGFCYYLDGAVECKIDDVNIEQFKSSQEQNKIDLNVLGGYLLNAAGSAVFFRKAKHFSHQMEYRWVWSTDHEVDGSIIIEVPEARRFCLPLYLSDM